jgi:hypothetical protein
MNEKYRIPLTVIIFHHRRYQFFLIGIINNYQSSQRNSIKIPSLIPAIDQLNRQYKQTFQPTKRITGKYLQVFN